MQGLPSNSASDRARSLRPGTVLNDRYLLEQALGAGGTALVFRARDLHARNKAAHNAHVAIKIPKSEMKDRSRAIARLQHEFKHAQTLTHPNIVRVLDLDFDDQTWFMTMELIEGKSLAAILREWQTLSGDRKCTILTSCAKALIYAHSRDIVHGDFKPANVLVCPGGDVKVFDFGAATATDGEDTRIPAGTPAYASPQVLSGMRPDRRDDVFSFACVAYELLTGQHPFERRSSLEARDLGTLPARTWNLSASEWLALLSALAWEREQRPADIATLMSALVPEAVSTSPIAAASAVEEAPPAKDPALELPEELVPAQRSWGFFVFVAVALTVLVVATQRHSSDLAADSDDSPIAVQPVSGEESTMLGKPAQPSVASGIASGGAMGSYPKTPLGPEQPFEKAGSNETIGAEERALSSSQAPVRPLSKLSFGTNSIVTSESSIAAVFVVNRSEPHTGRVSVQWSAESGTAKAGEDFIANENGSIEFAEGQSQRAVYIPLRDDLLEEGEETFTVTLTDARGGRVGEVASIEAIIRDDD
jgi:serine/threonine protein kinase